MEWTQGMAEEPSNLKTCSNCRLRKPLTEYYRNSSRKDGYNLWCKNCLKPLIKKHKQSNKYKTLQAEYSKRSEVRDRSNHRRKFRRITNPEKYRAIDARERKKLDPAKVKARERIRSAINSGKIPKASTYTCSECNERQARHYHHHNGYEPEHWLDVVPVCTFCHPKVEKHASVR